jgi:light-regulated signal transduction histidine kinase (bacteriophytochrome)
MLAMRELEQFSYAIAHDFRIPLRAMESAVETLSEADPKPSPEVLRGLDLIRHHGFALEGMIDNLLELTRAAGRPLHLEAIEMEALVREAWNAIDAPKSAQLIVAKLPAGRADRSMLKLVWANLLASAVRYAEGQSLPRIEVTGGERQGHRVYGVRVHGFLFSMEFAGTLVQVYERIQERYPGTGVGLAIVQRLVTRHHGAVCVEAHHDRGMLLQFSLPIGDPGSE